MKIGDKIRILRREKGMTQSVLASHLGLSTSAVGFWETNQRQPDIVSVVKLSNIFEVTTDYLLGNEKEYVVKIVGKGGNFKMFELSDEQIETIGKFIEMISRKK